MAELGYPAEWEADVLLRNGRPIHLRPITPDDGDALRAFHASLSDRTVYFRFFSAKPRLTDADVTYFTAVDHRQRVALVAVDAEGIVGVGRFDVIDGTRAEVAFVIRDDMQGLGLGSVLLEHLAAAARERGVRRFVAEVLPENSRMIATFKEAGFEVSSRREEDVLAVSFDIEPTRDSVAVMQAREHRAEFRSVHRLLHPDRVAVVGASRRPGGLGHEVLRHIVAGGFAGDLVAVHPEVDAIEGVRCVRSLRDVDGDIDLVVVVVPAAGVREVIADAAAARAHALVVVSGGFGDSGPAGVVLQSGLVAEVHRTGMRLVGPNALGIMNTDPAVRLNASLVATLPPAGRVGFFSQSGALGGAILRRLEGRGLGVSSFVSAGNRADISGNDLLQYWEEDPGTDLVMLYLETIGNARKFARIVRRLAPRKPVVMVRTGGAGQRHPLGHAVTSTGLDQRAVDQILGDCGLIVVESIDQMLDVTRIASSQPLPSNGTVRVVGNSDALAVMAVNAMAGTGLQAAGEPVTFARQESPEAYEAAIREAREDPGVGAVLAIYVPAIEHGSDARIRETLSRCAEHGTVLADGTPLVAVMVGADASDRSSEIPTFEDLEDALEALGAVARYSQWRRDADDEDIPPPGLDVRVADDGSVGGARQNVSGAFEAGPALALLNAANVTCRLADGGRESVLGLRVRLIRDPLFGPVLVAGIDDPVAEALDDRSYRLAPVTPTTAGRMLDQLAAIGLIAEETGDRGRLAGLLSQVSALVRDGTGVTAADLRHVSPDLTLTAISATVTDVAVTPEPAARRLS